MPHTISNLRRKITIFLCRVDCKGKWAGATGEPARLVVQTKAPTFPCGREMASFAQARQFRRAATKKGCRHGDQEGEEQAPDGRPTPCAGSRPARAQVAVADQARDGDAPLDDQARDREPPRGVRQDVLRAQVQPVRPPRRMPRDGPVREAGLPAGLRELRHQVPRGLVPALRGGALPPPRRRAVRLQRMPGRAEAPPAQVPLPTHTSSRTRATAGP